MAPGETFQLIFHIHDTGLTDTLTVRVGGEVGFRHNDVIVPDFLEQGFGVTQCFASVSRWLRGLTCCRPDPWRLD